MHFLTNETKTIMKVDTGFDPAEGKVIITVQTPLLERHLGIFQHIFEKSKRSGMPRGVTVETNDDKPDTAFILFPVDRDDMSIKKEFKEQGAVGIKMEYMKTISDEINHFVMSALQQQLQSLEFIPLNGYPVENLMTEVKDAVKGKRGFCIIKTYDEYLKSQEHSKDSYTFHQYIVEYGTDEYADVAINLYKGELQELREKYEPKLSFQNWI